MSKRTTNTTPVTLTIGTDIAATLVRHGFAVHQQGDESWPHPGARLSAIQFMKGKSVTSQVV